MVGFTFSTKGHHTETEGIRSPKTNADSKGVMLKAEHRDTVHVGSVEDQFLEEYSVPDSLRIKQRTITYFGPKLLAENEDGTEFLLTAPGPGSQLMLWVGKDNTRGKREGWIQLAEVSARLPDSIDKYHLCPQCGDPLKTADHERQASLGMCRNSR